MNVRPGNPIFDVKMFIVCPLYVGLCVMQHTHGCMLIITMHTDVDLCVNGSRILRPVNADL